MNKITLKKKRKKQLGFRVFIRKLKKWEMLGFYSFDLTHMKGLEFGPDVSAIADPLSLVDLLGLLYY